MASLYDLIPRVAPYLPRCPDAILRQALREVMHDFCASTHAWRETLEIDTVASQTEYTMSPSGNATICHVRDVRVDDMPIRARWNEEDTLILTSSYPAGKAITVDVALIPDYANATYPDALIERWGVGVVAGVLARLQSMTAEPWFAQSWEINERKYNDEVARAKMINMVGKTGQPKPPVTWIYG